jgi:hypothetical protein
MFILNAPITFCRGVFFWNGFIFEQLRPVLLLKSTTHNDQTMQVKKYL